MMKCAKGYKRVLGIFKIKQSHLFLFSNAFSTLESINQYDLVKTCQRCGEKQVIEIDLITLLEVVRLYPNAFTKNLKEYLSLWTV